jgi:hypothetical protein
MSELISEVEPLPFIINARYETEWSAGSVPRKYKVRESVDARLRRIKKAILNRRKANKAARKSRQINRR